MSLAASLKRQELKSRAARWTVSAIIAAWLLLNAGSGLFAYFTADDIMCGYWGWEAPLHKLIVANLFPFTALFRPFGLAVYRLGFAVFGLHPLPFRMIVYTLLLLNAWLVFRLAKRLTGSAEIGVLAAFLMSFHRRLIDIYSNNGALFDVFCCTFYALTLLYYCHVRDRGRFHGVQYLALYALAVATLNSKEIGATLPAMLLGYEFIYLKPASWQWRPLLRWALVDAAPAWMTAMIVMLSMWRKMGSQSGLANNAEYTPQFSLDRYFTTTGRFLDNIFWQPQGTFTTTGVLVVFSLLIVIALLARRKHIWFCTLFILVGPVPANFIVPRGLYAIYVVLIAWTIYASSLLVESRDWLYTHLWKRPPLPAGTWEPERVFLFLAVAISLCVIDLRDRPSPWTIVTRRTSPVYHLQHDLQKLNLKLTPGSRVLFLDDRFTKDDWIPVLLLRMLYHQPEVTVDRVKWMDHQPRASELDTYDYVFDYEGDRLVQVRPHVAIR